MPPPVPSAPSPVDGVVVVVDEEDDDDVVGKPARKGAYVSESLVEEVSVEGNPIRKEGGTDVSSDGLASAGDWG